MENIIPVAKGFLKSWPIFLQSLILSFAGVFLWEKFHIKIHNLFGIKTGMITFTDLGSDLVSCTPGLIYATLVGFSINRIMGQNSRLKSAIATLNAQMFLEERDRRTLSLVHIMMIMIVFIITIMLFLCTYSSIEIGRLVIGSFIFLASMIYIVSVELDDPFTGIWKIQDTREIPEGWMTMTIYDILNNKVEHIGNPHFPKNDQTNEDEKKEVDNLD